MGIKRKLKKSQADEEITFNEAFELYLHEKEANGLAPVTIKGYASVIEVFARYLEITDETLANSITQSEIFRYINHLKNTGVSPTSVRTYIRTIRTFLYWCMEEPRKYIQPEYKIKLPKAAEEQLKFFTDDEVELLVAKPKKNASFVEWRTWAITNWVLATGNRASTILDFRLDDIDYKRKEIVLHHTKSGKAQILPLSSTLEIVIKEYIRMWRRDAEDDGYLFPNVGEEKLQLTGLMASFNRYATSRGVSKTSIHGLRHTFARLWVKNNGNLFQLQKILGHSSLDMTKRYAKLFGEDLKEDYDRFSPLDTISRSRKRTQKVKNRF